MLTRTHAAKAAELAAQGMTLEVIGQRFGCSARHAGSLVRGGGGKPVGCGMGPKKEGKWSPVTPDLRRVKAALESGPKTSAELAELCDDLSPREITSRLSILRKARGIVKGERRRRPAGRCGNPVEVVWSIMA